jgi:hypothetical protein
MPTPAASTAGASRSNRWFSSAIAVTQTRSPGVSRGFFNVRRLAYAAEPYRSSERFPFIEPARLRLNGIPFFQRASCGSSSNFIWHKQLVLTCVFALPACSAPAEKKIHASRRAPLGAIATTRQSNAPGCCAAPRVSAASLREIRERQVLKLNNSRAQRQRLRSLSAHHRAVIEIRSCMVRRTSR